MMAWLVDPPAGSAYSQRIFATEAEARDYEARCPGGTKVVAGVDTRLIPRSREEGGASAPPTHCLIHSHIALHEGVCYLCAPAHTSKGPERRTGKLWHGLTAQPRRRYDDAPTPPERSEATVESKPPRIGTVTAATIATEAVRLVGGNRAYMHGDKSLNFANTAALWNAILTSILRREGLDRSWLPILTPLDVANMLEAFKIARRYSGTHNLDDYIDGAGYAACGGEIAERASQVQPLGSPTPTRAAERDGCAT